MAVDKDLLNRGNKEYAPDKCCILPETINSALASATKRRNPYSKRFMLSVLIMTKQGISSLQGSHHLGMINKLSCIIGTQRKKRFKNINYSRNLRLEYWH